MPLALVEYSKIRAQAKRFCLKMKFNGEEDDFASFAVAKAWQIQGPINYRFTWFGWLRERYCTVNGRRDEDLHIEGEMAEILDKTEEKYLLNAQSTEAQCEDWTRLAHEISLRPHTVEYAVFMLFFNLGYTPNEIGHITGYTGTQIRSYIREHTRDLSRYYDLPMIRRRTNRFR